MTKRLTRKQRATLRRAEAAIQRAQDNFSKQPRFAADAQRFFAGIFGWVTRASDEEPEYRSDSCKRDEWLRIYARKEPHLMGVLNSVIAIDKNRGWSLIGGRNQVLRYTKVAHSYEAAPGLYGWRSGISSASLSFYSADINAIVETGRDGQGGPLRQLYHVDPARCRLTGNMETPLEYNPSGGKQAWTPQDFFRVASFPSTDENYHGLGFCAVSRCLELAKLMVAIYQHDLEKLGAKMPRGLLLLKGIGETQWQDAMEAREARMSAKERQYYGGVEILASEGATGDIEAKLVALSNLPDDFDLETFTNLLMYGYALSFGYDPSEFWPVQFGALGRGTETEVQHRKATGKGGLDFALGFQEMFQEQLPESLHFEFDQRDDEGALLEAEVAQAWAEVAKTLTDAGLTSIEEGRSLLAEESVIPREWTEIEEDSEATDVQDADVERFLSLPRIQRAIETFPGDPITRYRWPADRTEVLWSGPRKLWSVQRQDDVVLYESDDGEVVITEADVERAIEQGQRRVGDEFAELLTAEAVE